MGNRGQTIHPSPTRASGLLRLARLTLATVSAGLLAMSVVSLPEYYQRVTTLTVRPLSLDGELLVSNALIQAAATARGLSLSAHALYEILLAAALLFPFGIEQ